jgi:hypothetical protein
MTMDIEYHGISIPFVCCLIAFTDCFVSEVEMLFSIKANFS